MPTSRREFIKIGAAGVIGAAVASAIEIPILEGQIGNENNKAKQLQDQKNSLQNQINQGQGFLTLNADQRPEVEALAEAFLPSDSNGPGAKEAGAIYFVDRMLAGYYGKAANMYMQGPFVQPQTGSVTVSGAVYPSTQKSGITYSGGTITPRLQAGTSYQYPFDPWEFWRRGLQSLQDYCQAAKGGKFETLSPSVRETVLQELFTNDPNNTALQSAFQGPTAAEFYNEAFDMVTAGYWTDPLYGGNMGLVGWNLLAFPGLNQGTSQGYNGLKLATSSTPVRLPPLSLGDVEKGGSM